MNYFVFDIETDGLKASLIHVLSYQLLNSNYEVTKKDSLRAEEIRPFLKTLPKDTIFVGHNIIRYDNIVLNQLLNINISYERCIDTLALSFYLFPNQKLHGLEVWGKRVGKKKIEVEDWKNNTFELYKLRCEVDVEINVRIFKKFMKILKNIYGSTKESFRLISYLSFNFQNLADQEQAGISLDIHLVLKTRHRLQFALAMKTLELKKYMPRVIEKKRPKVYKKKNGELSVKGAEWHELLKERDLPLTTKAIYKDGNPGSPVQLKEWLFSLGWKPETFKTSEATGEEVPQISLPFGQGICGSVKKLYKKEPNLQHIEGYYMLRHRLGLFDAFLEKKDENDKIIATAHGFAKTLRLQHSKPVVNLPGVHKEYGKEIRGSLITPDDKHKLVGFDISSLEDKTKMHYIYNYDPQYVKDMSSPDYDAHLDISNLGGLITEEEIKFYKWYKKKNK